MQVTYCGDSVDTSTYYDASYSPVIIIYLLSGHIKGEYILLFSSKGKGCLLERLKFVWLGL